MRLFLRLAILAAAFCVGFFGTRFALASPATTHSHDISRVAAIFAEHNVPVACYDVNEFGDPFLDGAWGETNIFTDEILLAKEVCDGLIGVVKHDAAVPTWEKAIGVLVLVHESYHARHWLLRGDEARVECAAIRHFKVGAALLGATSGEVETIFPYAVAFHYRLVVRAPEYYLPDCKVPFFYGPDGPRG